MVILLLNLPKYNVRQNLAHIIHVNLHAFMTIRLPLYSDSAPST